MKVILKHLIVPIGFVLRQPPGLRVLLYHRVNRHPFRALGLVSREISVSTDAFDRQMAYLVRRGFRSIGLDEARRMIEGECPLDTKAVLITFDDGYTDNLTDAAPILKRHGFKAVVFPVLGMIGSDNREWPMSDPKALGDFMDEKQLKDWLAQGHEVGSHTMSHPVLTDLGDADLRHELQQSHDELEKRLGISCNAVAYPGGNVEPRVAAMASAAGYQLGFTTQSGRSSPGTDPARLRRTEVSISDTQLVFRLKMAGVFDWTGVRDTPYYRRMMRAGNRAFAALTGQRQAKPG
ncbi:polysaccharide deacetylase family protein [Aquicoccus sp. G2-2]|uniref:polysaccharide deacetylase family protein n=1 Tax=Aquicoccus sp. G2-2 TaxID=3092120 RepID=UPI002ADFFDEF|nr:polysaccharide deacetylase family protein [Aquicoccus sp. G2-2]MEA1114616.1 polysaccharide deacetylase family protein [Aquicoccus sp. G2-2]